MRTIPEIPYGTHPLQRLSLYLPESHSFDTLVWFHGGCLERGSRNPGPMAALCAEQNIAVASADYRLYPQAHYPDFLLDAAQAVAFTWNHIKEYGASQRLFIGGSSAGAYLSMMLMLHDRWLGAHSMSPMQASGFIHNAGQPTTHFNVLRERGLDSRRVLVDEAAPLFHVGTQDVSLLPPSLFILAQQDMPGRCEQIALLRQTLREFGYPESHNRLAIVPEAHHCSYDRALDAQGKSVLGRMICSFIQTIDR